MTITLAEQAIRYIRAVSRDREPGTWILNTEVCAHLSVKANAMVPSLAPAEAKGLIERSLNSSRCTQWRLPVQKSRRASKAKSSGPTFGIDWPPGFVSKFDTVKVPDYEQRRK
jgi:hypothetical protein